MDFIPSELRNDGVTLVWLLVTVRFREVIWEWTYYVLQIRWVILFPICVYTCLSPYSSSSDLISSKYPFCVGACIERLSMSQIAVRRGRPYVERLVVDILLPTLPPSLITATCYQPACLLATDTQVFFLITTNKQHSFWLTVKTR